LITAAKTYLKSAIIVVDQIEAPLNDREKEMAKQVYDMAKEIYAKANEKSNKFDLTKDVVRKKINKVRWTASWLLNKLEPLLSG